MWNHKVYQTNPVLIKDDGPIRKYRNWYQQFYSTVAKKDDSAEINQNPKYSQKSAEVVQSTTSDKEVTENSIIVNGHADKSGWKKPNDLDW